MGELGTGKPKKCCRCCFTCGSETHSVQSTVLIWVWLLLGITCVVGLCIFLSVTWDLKTLRATIDAERLAGIVIENREKIDQHTIDVHQAFETFVPLCGVIGLVGLVFGALWATLFCKTGENRYRLMRILSKITFVITIVLGQISWTLHTAVSSYSPRELFRDFETYAPPISWAVFIAIILLHLWSIA